MKKTLAIVFISLGLMGCPSQETIPSVTSPSPLATPSEVAEGEMLTGALQADVQFDREVYFPGDEIEIIAVATGLSDTAWVGVVPSKIPHGQEKDNDANDLGYVYLRDTPRLTLAAPKEVGEYDVRLNDNDDEGKEIASRSFRVEADPQPVSAPRLQLTGDSQVSAGSKLEVQFEAPLTFASDAWIGVVPSKTAHGEEVVNDQANLGYQHLGGRGRGKVVLVAPAEVGKYDIRMFDTDEQGKEVGSVSFQVTAK